VSCIPRLFHVSQGVPCTIIQFDPSLLSSTIDVITLDNERLVLDWGTTVHRIRLQRRTAVASGKLLHTILSVPDSRLTIQQSDPRSSDR
jgi:hypothetical protein